MSPSFSYRDFLGRINTTGTGGYFHSLLFDTGMEFRISLHRDLGSLPDITGTGTEGLITMELIRRCLKQRRNLIGISGRIELSWAFEFLSIYFFFSNWLLVTGLYLYLNQIKSSYQYFHHLAFFSFSFSFPFFLSFSTTQQAPTSPQIPPQITRPNEQKHPSINPEPRSRSPAARAIKLTSTAQHRLAIKTTCT